MTVLIFDYDDNLLDIVERIDNALEEFGLTLQFDGQCHDGIEVCELKRLETDGVETDGVETDGV